MMPTVACLPIFLVALIFLLLFPPLLLQRLLTLLPLLFLLLLLLLLLLLSPAFSSCPSFALSKHHNSEYLKCTGAKFGRGSATPRCRSSGHPSESLRQKHTVSEAQARKNNRFNTHQPIGRQNKTHFRRLATQHFATTASMGKRWRLAIARSIATLQGLVRKCRWYALPWCGPQTTAPGLFVVVFVD